MWMFVISVGTRENMLIYLTHFGTQNVFWKYIKIFIDKQMTWFDTSDINYDAGTLNQVSQHDSD